VGGNRIVGSCTALPVSLLFYHTMCITAYARLDVTGMKECRGEEHVLQVHLICTDTRYCAILPDTLVLYSSTFTEEHVSFKNIPT